MSYPKKIVCLLSGGLGNQLFLYSAAYSLAKRNKAQLFIDKSYGFYRDKIYRRKYLLNKFKIDAFEFNINTKLIPFLKIKRRISLSKNKNRDFFKRRYIFQEFLDFDERLNKFLWEKGEVIFSGYWQSYKYFDQYEEDIRKQFNLDINISKEKLLKIGSISNKNNCCIHFRFFNSNVDSFKASYMFDYYLRAIKYFKDELGNPTFIIFSNNTLFAKEILKLYKIKNYSFCNLVVDDDSSISDFYLMTQFSNFIIANSTLSWWTAWLSNKRNKKIVCPGFKSYEDIGGWGFEGQSPSNWVRI